MFDKDDLQQLYRYCYSLTCNEHDAHDLLQGALEKYLKSNVDAKQPTAYMKKIIYHRFVDDCRREKIVQFESLDGTNIPADFDVQTLEELCVNEELIEKILKSLQPDEREIMYCWAIEGFSTAEIAKKLDKPKGTILSKIYRMRLKLIEQFTEYSNDIVDVKS
ncbi:MAG: RNA polymerase sigma factor [Woeseiaceae bacterium]